MPLNIKVVLFLFLAFSLTAKLPALSIARGGEDGLENVSEHDLTDLIKYDCVSCPKYLDYEKFKVDIGRAPWLKQWVKNSAPRERNSLFTAWELLTESGSSFAGDAIAGSETVFKNLASDLRANQNLYSFFRLPDGVGVNSGGVRAWERLFTRNVPEALRPNIPFLTRLADNPSLVNFIDNLTEQGKVVLNQNMEEWVKLYDVRVYLKSSGFDEAVDILEGTAGTPVSGGYVATGDPGAAPRYESIAQSNNHVSAISQNLAEHITGSITPPQSLVNRLTEIVSEVKEYLFLRNHLVETSHNKFTVGKFALRNDIADIWENVANTSFDFDDAENLLALIKHEYVESGLMKEGMLYARLTSNGPSSFKYGAHDLAPVDDYTPSANPQNNPFGVWETMNRSDMPPSIQPDFSNIDDVVDLIKQIEGL